MLDFDTMRLKLKKELPILLLLLFAAAMMLSGLGRFAFKDYDEATYALVAAEMAESGDYLYLTHGGRPWLDKPPLLFWLIGAITALFGFGEFALRLPGALLGIATVVVTYAFTFALSHNRRTALISAAILLTTSQFVYTARELRFDVPVGLGILLAVYCFVRGWQKPVWYLGMGAGLAAAILFKSVVSVFIPLLIIVFSVVYREWKWVRQPLFWASAFSGVAVAAMWYMLQYRVYGELFINTHLGRHGFARYTDPFLGTRNTNISYFFVLGARLLQPWLTVFAVAAVSFVLRARTMAVSTLRRPILATFLSVVAIVGVFSFSQSKLFYYFDPIYPFLAVFLGLSIMFWWEHLNTTRRVAYGACIGLFFLVALTNTIWQAAEVKGSPRGFEYALAEDERTISRILIRQTASSKLYTLRHDPWDTIRFYTRERAEPLFIGTLTPTVDDDAFYLLIPTAVLSSIELNPVLAERLEPSFRGKRLTLFIVRALQ